MRFEQLLEKNREIDWYARLVNTLSLMEYIGARKIMKSQTESGIDQSLLNHMAEEIRHAQILKRLALKMSEGALGSYSGSHVLGEGSAQAYMQAIDRGAAEILGEAGPLQVYSTVTWLIEERAMRIYPACEAALDKIGFAGYFRAILKEEEKHLAEMKARVALPAGVSARLLQLEAAAFSRLMAELSWPSACSPDTKAC